jgi:hypothetical protein
MKIEFEGEITIKEIPAFRGAIIEKVGRDNILFHNHIDDKKFLYEYPKIQYKSLFKKPTIICLDKGVDEIHNLFQFDNDSIRIKGEGYTLNVQKVDVRKINLQTWDSKISYQITNWLALNQTSFDKYLKLESEKERKEFLEKILIGNILSFAKGINWNILEHINLSIDWVRDPYSLKFKGKKWLSFTAGFSTNISLPQYIGLGRGVSHGFGTIKFSSKKKHENE